jgi:fatty acid-binding protein DegV
VLGTALNLKPQLVLNPETGIIEPGERTRTRSKAIEAMWSAFFKSIDTSKPLHLAVHHAAALPEAQQLEARLRHECQPVELFMNELTPVIGTHAGPGTLAVVGYYEA